MAASYLLHHLAQPLLARVMLDQVYKNKELPELDECYIIGGRPPIVITGLSYGTGKRIEVSGYTPRRYADILKTQIYDGKTQRTLAELEGIKPPPATRFRYNSATKLIKLNKKELVPDWHKLNPSYATDHVDELLGKSRAPHHF